MASGGLELVEDLELAECSPADGAAVEHGGVQRPYPSCWADQRTISPSSPVSNSTSRLRAWRVHRNEPADSTGSGRRSRWCCGRGSNGSSCARRLAVVAVGARIGQDLDAVVAHLDGQGIGVRMGCDRQEPVGAGVAAAPDLGRRRDGALRMMVRPASSKWPGRRSGRPACGDDEPWTPAGCWSASAPQPATTPGRRTRPRRGRGGSTHRLASGGPSTRALPSSPSPWRGARTRHVDGGGHHVEHAAQQLPRVLAERSAGAVGLGCGHQRRARPRSRGSRWPSRGSRRSGRCCLASSSSSTAPACAAQRAALCEPVEGERRHELAGRLGDHVVVGRRPPAAERRQVALVPPDLGDGILVALEQCRLLRSSRRGAGGSTPRR